MKTTLKAGLLLIAPLLAIQVPCIAYAEDGIVHGIRMLDDAVVVRSMDLTSGEDIRAEKLRSRPGKKTPAAFSRLPSGELLMLRKEPLRKKQQGSRLDARPPTVPSRLPRDRSGIKIRDLEPGVFVDSATPINNDQLLGIASRSFDTPPFFLALIDLRTSTVRPLEDFRLSPHGRYSNITRCPDGSIYATTLLIQDGSPHLAKLDLDQKRFIDQAELKIEHTTIRNDLKDLACSASNQLYALADPWNRGTNALFSVDDTGNMTLFRTFDVDKITFGFPLTPIDRDFSSPARLLESAANEICRDQHQF